MKKIEREWGPFDPEEIEFYKKELRSTANGEIINEFQKSLVFNIFYKYFGDSISINAINSEDYIKLIIVARRILRNQFNMAFLPYIISGKVNKIVSRKTLNKKEISEMESSQYYSMVVDKYKNQKILQNILGTIATIITSSFSVIDYKDPELNGKVIDPVVTRIIIEEFLMYVLLI